MIRFLIPPLAVFLIGFLFAILSKKYKKPIFEILALCFLPSASFLFGYFIHVLQVKEIPAIEVYRGNTTLKVNGYQIDGIFVPEDSVVVIKPHFDNPALQDTSKVNKMSYGNITK